MQRNALSALAIAVLCTWLAACAMQPEVVEVYRYVAAPSGAAPATLKRSAVLEDKDKSKLVRVKLLSINGAPVDGGMITQIAPGRVKLHVVVENVKRNNVKPVTVEFEFDAKAKEKYRFDVSGDEWSYVVALKDSKNKTLLQKEFIKAAVVRSSILDL